MKNTYASLLLVLARRGLNEDYWVIGVRGAREDSADYGYGSVQGIREMLLVVDT